MSLPKPLPLLCARLGFRLVPLYAGVTLQIHGFPTNRVHRPPLRTILAAAMELHFSRRVSTMKQILIVLCCMFASASAAWAQSSPGSIKIEHAWARASSGATGAAYVTIENIGSADDRLIAATAAVAAKAELHLGASENGVMKMHPVAAIDVQAKGRAVLKPGGLHIMLIDLKQPLKAGDSFPLTLTFEKAGKIETKVTIEKAGSMGDMKDMKM